MKLIVLGCGDAFASEGRFNTSFLLEDEGEHVLIDCGASTLIRLKQERVTVDQISTIFITHFHGDHYGGLPFILISRFFEVPSAKLLRIVGPKGIKEKVFALQETMYPGTSERINSDIVFLEYQDSTWTTITEELEVYAREVVHSPPSNPHGLKIRWKEVAIAFSGDTEWTDSLIDLADGAELFICESNQYENQSVGHLSYKKILEKLPLLKANRIYLTHMNSEVLQAKEFDLVRLTDGMEFTL